jgi:hypothetical protein
MYAPLVRSDYYGASAPSRAFNERRVYPTDPGGHRAAGTMRDGSRVHREPIDQLGTQLCPGSIATTTPQSFIVASPPTGRIGFGVNNPQWIVVHCIPARIYQI